MVAPFPACKAECLMAHVVPVKVPLSTCVAAFHPHTEQNVGRIMSLQLLFLKVLGRSFIYFLNRGTGGTREIILFGDWSLALKQ